MDSDLESLSREQLAAEVRRLRAGIRAHRDSSGQDLCWHHPALWALLPEREDPLPAVPEWPEFLAGCIRYRRSLDAQAPDAPRTRQSYEDADAAPPTPATLQLLVNIDVPDLGAGERFYCAALGLVAARRIGPAALELLGASAPIYLLETAAAAPAVHGTDLQRSFGRHWTPLHLDIVTDDIDTAVARAQAAGAVLEQPVSTSAWGRLAPLSDPFGNGFCFVQFLGRGYDALVPDRA